jgi:transcriptional regulator with GAF, ATPase, and Fis domain
MLNKNFCETENLQWLARFDFLDLCLLGETGTGKTHAARLIHDFSPRARQPFIAVNCAELTPSIIEAELFGYEKGAFTGAGASRTGKFEAADGGTLFLDEIGELPSGLQAKLLKVTEEKSITRVGGNHPRFLDVRIIYATHRDLSVFREDLRYRIAAHAIELKPLRERRDEIVPLAKFFLSEFNRKSGRIIKANDETLKLLELSEWQGNIRELRSFIELTALSALFAHGETSLNETFELTGEFLLPRLSILAARVQEGANFCLMPGKIPLFVPGDKMEEYLERIETHLVKTALDAHNNNRTRAARHLGISRSGLIKKLKRLNH